MTPGLNIIFNDLPALLEAMPEKVSQVVRKTALDVVAGCKDKSRVDTGEMRAGWTAEEQSKTAWLVFNPVEHTFFNEFGTKNMSAQPMLTPSIEENRQAFEDAFKVLGERL